MNKYDNMAALIAGGLLAGLIIALYFLFWDNAFGAIISGLMGSIPQ